MHHSFKDFLRHGGHGEYVLHRKRGQIHGQNLSRKSRLPGHEQLRMNFQDRLDAIAAQNADMLLDALADAYEPPLNVQDLPDISLATDETLAEWDQRMAVIWAEWHSHPQRPRPIRLTMEEHLLRGYAGLINEIRQRDLGIEQYVWETVGDDRVRTAHSSRNGAVHSWDSDDEKPGEAVNCRCTARPVPPGIGTAYQGSVGLLDSFLSSLDKDFSVGLGERPQSFAERLQAGFYPEAGVTIDGEMLDAQTQGDLATAFFQIGDAIKKDPEVFLSLVERHGDGFARLASVFGISNPSALATAAALSVGGAPESLVEQALTQSRGAIDRFIGGTATSLVDIAQAIRGIPDIRWSDIRQAAEAIYADPSSLPEAMVAPFRERIAVGDYAGALGYGLPEVLASAAALGRVRRRAEALSQPEILTLERLRTDPDFIGITNAGPYTPTFERWIESGGTVELMPAGHFRYAAEIDLFGQKQHVSVEYPGGYPDFRPFMTHPSGIRSVEIDVTGINHTDVKAANIAAGHAEWGRRAPAGWTWHHLEDARTMQLTPREINSTFNHLGGASKARNQ